MGWQRRSSGNNYASLSGHAFLIGAHTRRVIACVVFSKKCSICESKRRKAALGAGKTAAAPDVGGGITALPNPPNTPPGTVDEERREAALGAGKTAAAPDVGGGITALPNPPNTPPGTVDEERREAALGAGKTAAAPDVSEGNTATPNPPSFVVEDISANGIGANDVRPADVIHGLIDTDDIDHPCTMNYDGSSGAMESDGILLLMIQLQKKYNDEIYLDYIITDDDTKMKKYLTHPKYLPRGKKNIGGSLPIEIPQPNWYADPTHRAKCVAGSFFELCKGKKSDIRANKLDAFRMKKYYSYYIKQNRGKGISYLMKHAMAPLDHMFDDHSLCDSSWCHKKRREEGGTTCPSERDNKGYYRCKKADAKLYDVMKQKYERYVSEQFLTQCCHMYDTQVNEGLNRSVAKYVPKGTNYCTTTSLITRVYLAAGIQLVGNHFLWTEIFRTLSLSIPVQTELYLLDLDKRKLRNFCREHDFANMAKRKKKEHEKVRAHLEQVKRDQQRNATYTSRTGCEIERETSDKVESAAANCCKYRDYGCSGQKKHKTNRSKLCKFYGMTHAEIIGKLSGFKTDICTKILFSVLNLFSNLQNIRVQQQYKILILESRTQKIPRVTQKSKVTTIPF